MLTNFVNGVFKIYAKYAFTIDPIHLARCSTMMTNYKGLMPQPIHPKKVKPRKVLHINSKYMHHKKVVSPSPPITNETLAT